MRNIITSLLILIAGYTYGQVDLSNHFKLLYDNEEYQEIIEYKPKKNEELTAKALYYKGMVHYLRSEDKQAMKYLDLAIDTGPVDHDMFYYKGMIYFYSDELPKAISYFDKAIALLPNEPDFYLSKGEALYGLEQVDSAIVYFEKATGLSECKTEAFLTLGEAYQEQNQIIKALEAYKTALEKLTPSDGNYQICSFNVGLMQQLAADLIMARESFEKHISQYPLDYHAMAKLIQVYYGLEEFNLTLPYKEKLYAAHQTGELPDAMKRHFCFDQFMWKGQRIMVFENFDEPESAMFVKHQFYLLDEQGNIDSQIDSESSIAIRMNDPNRKYVLCWIKNGAHHTYWQYGFNDNYKYPVLKEWVLNILNKKLEPDAMFIPGKKDH